MTVDIYNIEGKVTGTIELPEALFNVDVNNDLIALAIRVARANARQGTSKVKTRGELDRTTHKVWKQKGTGRARHGSKSAPIFVGGGVAHGPSGDQSYELDLPKKMRVKALKGVLTQSAKAGQVIVIDGLDKMDANTKAFTSMLSAMKADKKALVMLESPLTNIVRAGKNAADVVVTQAKRTNVLEIVDAAKVVIHKPALETLVATFAKNAVKAEVKPVAKKAAPKKTAAKKEVKE
jgi:large subunit ribosomal protein L4